MPVGYWWTVAVLSWGVACALNRWRRPGPLAKIPALRAHAALHNTGRPRRPWGRILRAPFFPGRRDVIRVRGLAYGDGPDRKLDVYHRRDRPARVPVLLHLHGGGFYSGNKAREARPLIRHLTSRRGFVCVSADYRLQPHVTLADQVADARAAI